MAKRPRGSLEKQPKISLGPTELRPYFYPLGDSYKPLFRFVEHVESYFLDVSDYSNTSSSLNYPQYTPLIDVRYVLKLRFFIDVNEHFSKYSDLSDLIHVIAHKSDGTSNIHALDSIAEMGSIRSGILSRRENRIEGYISFRPSQISTHTDCLFTFDFIGKPFFERALLLSIIKNPEKATLGDILKKLIDRAAEHTGRRETRLISSLLIGRENGQIPPVKLPISEEAKISYKESSS